MDALGQLKLHFSTPQFVILNMPNEDAWSLMLSFMARLLAYVVMLVLLVLIVSVILKFIGQCDCERTAEEEVTERETCPLRLEKAMPHTYGTCEEDLESGKCSSSSSEELYDGKICVICYDQQRNCFFVPCGHCATCYVCAQRIFDGESKTCPVCRRVIRKVRKLVLSRN